jgi:hypothetical protein
VLGGGDVFRREINGEPVRFNVFGLWGSGNVVTERHLLPTGTNTAYSMWDGHPLFGPGTESLEKVPILLDDLPLSEVLDRYSFLSGEDCLVWTGEEVVGIDCESACDNLAELCGPGEREACLEECAGWPRAIRDCIETIGSCEAQTFCNREDWARRQETTEDTAGTTAP